MSESTIQKPNFRDKLRGGESLAGFQLTSVSPHWPQHLSGRIDFVFIDCEHHCFSREQVAWLCAGYKAHAITPIVRVLEPRAALVRAAIDDGAVGVVVPYVETVDQTCEVVAAAKLRPIQGLRAASAMRSEPLNAELLNIATRHCGDTTLIIQIESEIAVDACQKLVHVDGVDGVLVGPFDLTATLGCLNDHADERFQEAVAHVAKVSRHAGVGAGIYFAGSPAKEQWAAQLGYNLMIRGCDWSLIHEALESR